MRRELGAVLLLMVGCSGTEVRVPRPLEATPASGSGGANSTFVVSPAPTAPPPDLGAPCDPTRTVDTTGASLVIRDVTTLQRFPLQRVLTQILATAGGETSSTPLAFLQTLFDSENAGADGVFTDVAHCDDSNNNAFGSFGQKPFYCPRAEGKLATSAGLLDESSPDFFAPVALVSRFDLMPSTFATCGEYRIVYAKQSGRSDPNDRVMLIFESALLNPGRSLKTCRPVAEFLAGVDSLQAGDDLANAVDTFYFQGLPGFEPVVHARHYGFGGGGCSYSGPCGQVRVGQGMQAPFEFRQFKVALPDTGELQPVVFSPTMLTSTPQPGLFDLMPMAADAQALQSEINGEIPTLIDDDITRLHAGRSVDLDVGESAVEGPAAPNFAARLAASSAGDTFKSQLAQTLSSQMLPSCPPDDPLTAASIIARTTALTCPGCHSPEQVLSNDLHIGCGETWPKTLAPVHIDEYGNLSPALTDVFLPRRADFLGTYLRACDADGVVNRLQPVPVRERLN